MIALGDSAVLVGTIAAVAVMIGMDIGEDRARRQLATRCEAQPGAILAATYQTREGVECSYVASTYGRAVRKQKAVKS